MKIQRIDCNDKSKCCGCTACANICPKNAITMVSDEYGFLFPKIDEDKCINCGLCSKACIYKNELKREKVKKAYASVTKNKDILKKSTSGGIFAELASSFLSSGGVVYGCNLRLINSKAVIEHIRIDNIDELQLLQGSKYVQSDKKLIFRQVKQDLKDSKKVLFSGTPCEVAALKRFLFNISMDNLFTIDIVCHGVPSNEMFNAYLNTLYEKEEKIDYKFRDKTEGWGSMGAIFLKRKNKIILKRIHPKKSSFYQLFLNTDICRDSCYSCMFANDKRVSDITIGDYWGIEKEQPELLIENGGSLSREEGISCVLINTEKGSSFIEKFGDNLLLFKSDLKKIAKNNHNLKSPSKKGENREVVFGLYKDNHNFDDINRWFKKKLGIKYYIYTVWIKLPLFFRRLIRKFINR